jgi:tetratricopeptide (TPR) repeat protein
MVLMAESAAALFNQALLLHVKGRLLEAKQLYLSLVLVVQNLLHQHGNNNTVTTTTTTRLAPATTWLLEMGMRVHNNLGLILYQEQHGDHHHHHHHDVVVTMAAARTHFQAALLFSKQLVVFPPPAAAAAAAAYQLEHATILSNWCRVHWMRGGGGGSGSGSGMNGEQHDDDDDDGNHLFYASLREILRIRSTLLSWDHVDVAAAHFNLAAAEYARGQMTPPAHNTAMSHLLQYLHIAAHHRNLLQQQLQGSNNNNNNNNESTTAANAIAPVVLDPMPALIYILLLQNEDKDDSMSQELVRGLRTLQDKRCSISGCSSHSHQNNNNSNNTAAVADVASVLNFIGTLLFHKQDLEHALLFFQEELRLEEQMALTTNVDDNNNSDKQQQQQQPDISVSVTCNNIGRILQELDQLEEAIVYYERALQAQYGDCCGGIQYNDQACNSNATPTTTRTTNTAQHPDAESSSAAANLYSTVWYNLGLIHDKRGCYSEAIVAFKMSLELRRSMLGRDHPDIACLYYNIGVLQMEQQQLTEASDSLHEALRVRCQQQHEQQQQGTSNGGGGGVAAGGGASNQLNDDRVIKTLEKLASLHKSNGAIVPAIDALRQVLRILQVSVEYDTLTRMKDLGLVLRSIAELYHTMGDVNSSLIAALHSVRQLEHLTVTMAAAVNNTTVAEQQQQQQHLAQHYYNIEQLVSSLLLVGSLHHEMNEPIKAGAIFRQAVIILESTIVATSSQQQHPATISFLLLPCSLFALREVAAMLCMTQCAPVA